MKKQQGITFIKTNTIHTKQAQTLGRLASGIVLSVLLSACGSDTPEQTEAIHLERAKAYAAQGQYKAATIEYRNALKSTGATIDTVLPYIDMMQVLGYDQGALEQLQAVPAELRNEAYYQELTEIYIALRKFSSAEKTLAEHVKADSPRVKNLQAQVAFGQGRVTEAQKLFDAVLASDPNNGQALLGKALILLQDERQAAAAGLLLDKVPTESEVYVKSRILQAGIAITTGELEKAEKILTDVLTRLPHTDQMIADKAVVLERLAYVLTR